MTDVLRSSAAWLESMRTTFAATTVTYSRSADSEELSVEVPATVGRTEFEIDETDGLHTQYVSRDYLILRSDLILGGNAVEPQSGDRITESDGSVYEVLSPGGSVPAWRWSDPYKVTYRIHTKQVTESD